jgi:hypothetical protein
MALHEVVVADRLGKVQHLLLERSDEVLRVVALFLDQLYNFLQVDLIQGSVDLV